MISLQKAKHLFEMWLELNNPTEFLQSNGVTGNGTLDHYHCISICVETGNIFYRTVDVPDLDNDIIDVIVMHEQDVFDNIATLSKDDCLDIIVDNYFKFKCKSAMNEIPFHALFEPDQIEFDFPQGTYGKMKRF